MTRFTRDDLRRKQMDKFRSTRGVDLALVRKIRTATPGGTGYVETDVTLPPQQFRWAPISSRAQPAVTTTAGQISAVTVQLVGEPDADVQVGDTLTTPEGLWRVVHIDPVRDIRTLADLKYLGKA
jgi:hypothetical protein